MLIRKKKQEYSRFQKCFFCENKKEPDYKEPEILRRFISDRSKIISRGRTGFCAPHQRKLAREIKRARILGLIPFITRIS